MRPRPRIYREQDRQQHSDPLINKLLLNNHNHPNFNLNLNLNLILNLNLYWNIKPRQACRYPA